MTADISRRKFLVAGVQAGAVSVAGLKFPEFKSQNLTPRELLGDGSSLDEATFRALATRAIDVARSSGAEFADLRINTGSSLGLSITDGQLSSPGVSSTVAINVRAVVNGAWGSASGSATTLAEVTKISKLATELAKAGRKRHPQKLDLAPAPVVTDGWWSTPIKRDPMTVPIGEQQALLLDAYKYVTKGIPNLKKYRGSLYAEVAWLNNDRGFASTEGSYIRQRVHHAYPFITALAGPPDDYTQSRRGAVDERLLKGGYGYECLSDIDIKESWQEAAKQLIDEVSVPRKSVDVGRYNIVFSPAAFGEILARTIGPALDLDRAIGNSVNRAGTTYAMPFKDVLGKYQIGSHLLTITGDRSLPGSGCTVGWDDEGVKPEDFRLVQDGIIVDYLTTRRNAALLSEWYSERGRPIRSHGSAVGFNAQIPNLTITPARENISVQDLVKSVKHGFYVDRLRITTDWQLLNTHGSVHLAYEIRDGKIGSMVKDMAIQFNTPKFWQSVVALGGADSVVRRDYSLEGKAPGNSPSITLSSVPALVRDVNVINTGRQG